MSPKGRRERKTKGKNERGYTIGFFSHGSQQPIEFASLTLQVTEWQTTTRRCPLKGATTPMAPLFSTLCSAHPLRPEINRIGEEDETHGPLGGERGAIHCTFCDVIEIFIHHPLRPSPFASPPSPLIFHCCHVYYITVILSRGEGEREGGR